MDIEEARTHAASWASVLKTHWVRVSPAAHVYRAVAIVKDSGEWDEIYEKAEPWGEPQQKTNL